MGFKWNFPKMLRLKCNFRGTKLKFVKLELGLKLDFRKGAAKCVISQSHLNGPTSGCQVATPEVSLPLSSFSCSSSSMRPFPEPPFFLAGQPAKLPLATRLSLLLRDSHSLSSCYVFLSQGCSSLSIIAKAATHD